MVRLGSENRFPLVRLLTDIPPSAAPAGQIHLFADTDKVLYWIDEDGTITPAGGGASLPAGATAGDLAVYDGAAWDILPAGTDGHVLTADSGDPLGLAYAAPTAAPTLQAAAITSVGTSVTGIVSTSFADVSSITHTFTTGARRVMCGLDAFVENNTAHQRVMLTLVIDGTNVGGTDGLAFHQSHAAGGNGAVSFVHLSDVLTAASHTFKVQVRVDGGSGTLYRNSSRPIHFFAKEVL